MCITIHVRLILMKNWFMMVCTNVSIVLMKFNYTGYNNNHIMVSTLCVFITKKSSIDL